jgi:hypothetical protein
MAGLARPRAAGYRRHVRRLIAHRRGYHEWPNSTPLLDVARTLVGAASVLVGAFAAVFAAMAARDGNGDQVAEYGLLGIVVANGLVEAAIRWRRHHW